MKALRYVLLWLLAANLAVSCNTGTESQNKGNADSAADASASPRDSAEQVNDNTVADSLQTDADYLVDAAHSSLKEMEMARFARQKVKHPEVVSLAKMIIDAHTVMNQKALDVAKRKGITLPTGVSAEEAQEIRNNDKTGLDFEMDFVDDMIDMHQKDIDRFDRAADRVKDGDIKKLFVDGLPELKKHLEMARTVRNSLERGKKNQ